MPLVEIGRQRLLAAKCCIEINRGATSSFGCFVAPPSDRMNWNAPSSTRPVDIVFVLPRGQLNLSAAPNRIQQSASHFRVDKRDVPLVEIGRQRLLAAKCCIENNRRADFLDWRVCRADAWPKEWDAPYPAFPVCRRHKCRWRAFRVRRRLKPQAESSVGAGLHEHLREWRKPPQ